MICPFGTDRHSIERLERELARLYGEIGALLAISPSTSILIAAERSVTAGAEFIDAAALNKE